MRNMMMNSETCLPFINIVSIPGFVPFVSRWHCAEVCNVGDNFGASLAAKCMSGLGPSDQSQAFEGLSISHPQLTAHEYY